MIRVINNKIFLLVLLGVVFSCQTILDTDSSLEAPRIVVNSIFTQDSIWNVSLTWTRNIRDFPGHYSYQPVGGNARVTLLDENYSPIEDLKFSPEGNFRFYSSLVSQSGKKYNIEVELKGEAILKGQSYVPLFVPILSASVDSSSYQLTEEVIVDVVFKDPVDRPDYYQVKVLKRINDQIGDENLNFTPVDQTLSNDYSSSENLLISDDTFNGREYKLQLRVRKSGYSQIEGPVRIVLESLSREYYQYSITKNLQANTSRDAFSQPVQIFTNIENGLGIFAGYSVSSVLINK